jgi:hypothetical protein
VLPITPPGNAMAGSQAQSRLRFRAKIYKLQESAPEVKRFFRLTSQRGGHYNDF